MGSLQADDKTRLLELADLAIVKGLQKHRLTEVSKEDLQGRLGEQRAAFVTLKINGQLRGCIGSLTAHRPLALDAVHNAYAAAFKDPRFPPLSKPEYDLLKIKISVLTKAVPMQFNSEEELLGQLQPGVDGLILTAGKNRGTFLPAVWQDLPDPVDFLRHLKLKAGLPEDFWSDEVKVERYTSEEFG